MIPVERQPEPDDFEEKVAAKGRKFLEQNSNPRNWKNRDYWTAALPDLWHAYSAICAYCCLWIPLEQGSASVDHFIPKSIAPERAYDWDNYRLAALKLNARKGNTTDVVDPFGITEGTFLLSFPAMLVKPNPKLPNIQKSRVWATIKRLKLNDDETLIQSRLRWILEYCDGHITFAHLQAKAPFIAYEIERQEILDKLPLMFRRRRIG